MTGKRFYMQKTYKQTLNHSRLETLTSKMKSCSSNLGFHKNLLNICFWCVLISFFICLMSPLKPLSTSTPATDSGVFLTISKGISSGMVPYRDFFDHKGPLLYFINWIGWEIGKTSGVWFIEILLMSIAAFFSFKTLKIFMSNKGAIAGTLLGMFSIVPFYEQGNLTEEYALPFIYIALFFFTDYFVKNTKISIKKLLLIGACFGSSVLLRPNMFAVWLVFSPLILLTYLYKKHYDLIIRFIFYFFIGTSLVFSPFAYYLLKNGAFNEFISQFFLFNSLYASQGISISVFIKNFISTIIKDFSWVSLFIPIYWSLITKGKIRIFHIACVFSALMSILLISLSRSNYGHYSMVMVPLISLQIGLIINHLGDLKNNIFKKTLLIIILLGLFFQSSLRWFFICSTIISDRSKIEISELSKIIEGNVESNDTFIVLGNNCSLYLYTDVKSASKYIYQLPVANISADILKGFINDVTNNKPKIVVLPLSLYSHLLTIKDFSKEPYFYFVEDILKTEYFQISSTTNYLVYLKIIK